MESTAVTSLQPAPMTRRARREAEQQAQALRARGTRAQGSQAQGPWAPPVRPQVTRPRTAPAQAPWPEATRPAMVPLAVALPAVASPAVASPAVASPAIALPAVAPPVPATRSRTSFDQVGTGAITRPARPTSAIPVGQRLISRATVIGTLAAATIAAPFVQGAGQSGESPFDVQAPQTGPNVLDLVTQPVERPETSGSVLRAEAITRPASAASRGFDRSPLPTCDPSAPVEGTNGALADHSLCELWQPGEYLRPDAAISLSALNEAFRASFGREICLVASYRDLDTQYELKASRGYFAASPGTSMHGWGLAIDLCSKETGDSEVFSWLWANAPSYGWQNPSWAQLGGSKYEPWHWEFVSGVAEKGEWHG